VQEELEPPSVEDFGASCVEEDLGASSGARAEEDAGTMNGARDMCLGAGVEEDAGAVGASIGTENIVGAISDRVPMICGRGKASSTAAEVGGTGTNAYAATVPDHGPSGEGETTYSGAYAHASSARVDSAETRAGTKSSDRAPSTCTTKSKIGNLVIAGAQSTLVASLFSGG
jgi:hypothetical protein